MRVLCASVLFFEAVVVALAIVPAVTLVDDHHGLIVWGGLGIVAVCLVAAGLLRHDPPFLLLQLDTSRLAELRNVGYEPQVVDPADVIAESATALPVDVLQFLYPSRYCQSDLIRQHAWDTLDPTLTKYEKMPG